MFKGVRASRQITVALFATLLLRASIPDGYMPAPVGGGLLFEICPSGIPAELLHAVSGSASHHHHHHNGTDTAGTEFDAEQCPIGQLLSAAVAVDTPWVEPEAPVLPHQPVASPQVLASRQELTRRPRGPPA